MNQKTIPNEHKKHADAPGKSRKKAPAPANLNELVYLARQNDEDAFHLLYEELKPRIMHIYWNNFHSRLSLADWESEAMLLLEQTIFRFRDCEEASFTTAYLKFLRHKGSEITRPNQSGRIDLQACSSLEVDLDGKVRSIEETGAYSGYLIEDEQRTYHKDCRSVLHELSPYLRMNDRLVLELFAMGYTASEIARTLRQNPRKVARVRERAAGVYEKLEAFHNGKAPEPKRLVSNLSQPAKAVEEPIDEAKPVKKSGTARGSRLEPAKKQPAATESL